MSSIAESVSTLVQPKSDVGSTANSSLTSDPTPSTATPTPMAALSVITSVPNASHSLLPSLPQTLPLPSLTLDFTLRCQLNPLIPLGNGPLGARNWISFRGGTWVATWGRGTILPGGQDAQLVIGDTLAAMLDTRYLLQTEEDDGAEVAHVMVETWGWRTGERAILERLLKGEGKEVEPHEYRFRLFVSLETGDARYKDLNEGMWVAAGMRTGNEGKLPSSSSFQCSHSV